jgi:hypothetical protein
VAILFKSEFFKVYLKELNGVIKDYLEELRKESKKMLNVLGYLKR